MNIMLQAPKLKVISWTHHARAKMNFYRLSESRVRQVLHSPRRVEEGVAPKTVAMMQPVSTRWVETGPSGAQRSRGTPSLSAKSGKRAETWTQEIWVMVQQVSGVKGQASRTKVISAWRYPGRTKPRSEVTLDLMKQAYNDYSTSPR